MKLPNGDMEPKGQHTSGLKRVVSRWQVVGRPRRYLPFPP